MWRLYNDLRHDVVYLDIESYGLGRASRIFMIGLFDGYDTKILFEPINYTLLQEYLNHKSLVVTYNGSSHDIPILEHKGIRFNMPHIDLKIILSLLGYSGGLKYIEREFSIKRNPLQSEFRGGDILRLWKIYKATGDEYYLNLLIEYNEDDVFYLKKLMEFSYKELSMRFQKQKIIYMPDKNSEFYGTKA
jgi:uncharacterized protein YprB with RNaseH-like and TPR domain